MDVLDDILVDWRACRPSGAVLQASQLGCVLDRVVARAEGSTVEGAAQRVAHELLAPDLQNGQLPCLVRKLRIDGRFRQALAPKSSQGLVDDEGAVIHFFFFWQAFREVCLRTRQVSVADEEPMAVEASDFRDKLLGMLESGPVAVSWLAEELASARTASADPAAWEDLEAAVAHVSVVGRCQDGKGKQSEQPMSLDEISTIFLMWLQELTEDYCRGERHACVRTVCDVLRCSPGKASSYLGASCWDVESALRRSYLCGPELTVLAACHGPAWSSKSARLSSMETQCPICAEDLSMDMKPAVTPCCYQLLCVRCATWLSNDIGELHCPFCRARNHSRTSRPLSPRGRLAPVVRCAERVARDASQVAKNLISNMGCGFWNELPRHEVPVIREVRPRV